MKLDTDKAITDLDAMRDDLRDLQACMRLCNEAGNLHIAQDLAGIACDALASLRFLLTESNK